MGNYFNMIYNDDCLTVLPKIDTSSIDLVLTDPPYFIGKEMKKNRAVNKLKFNDSGETINTQMSWDISWESKEEYLNFIKNVFIELVRVLKDDRHIILFVDKKDLSYIIKIGEDCRLKFRKVLFWRKTNPVPLADGIGPMTSMELAVWFTKGSVKKEHYNKNLGLITDVLNAPIPSAEGSKIRHPSQKPILFGLQWISYLTKPNDVVLDCFAGGGTFLLASKLLNRNYIGIESNKQYCENIQYRLNTPNSLVASKFNSFIHDTLKNKLDGIDKTEILTILGSNAERVVANDLF